MVNRLARLGAPFVVAAQPVPLAHPRLAALSAGAAGLLGLDPDLLRSEDALAALSGNRQLPGGAPVVTVHGGHRFGLWAGRLGDAGTLLLGEAVGAAGQCQEIRLDRAGRAAALAVPPPGDPAALLRAAIRAFLCSEALHALGIPTTRALAVLASDAAASRESAHQGAVLVRLAPDFLSFGHFEHFYFSGRHDALRVLADHLIDRALPHLRAEPQPYFALLRETTLRTARLVAAWQAAGFCHGLMNTDSMSMLGLTMDHGPFAFIEGFDAHHVANPSDTGGLYAWSAQPGVGERNCAALAQAMLPLVGSAEDARAAVSPYRREFTAELERLLRARLGLAAPGDADRVLFDRLFALLHENRADFTLFFRGLAQVRAGDAGGDATCRALCADGEAFDAWAEQYRQRLRQEARDAAERAHGMRLANPARVMRDQAVEEAVRQAVGIEIDQVAEAALDQAAEATAGRDADFSAIARLQLELSRPFEDAEPGFPASAAR
ncbi:protein adenylyltransferase SelO family protein [Quisquiliibacterium transsilvanicum]